MKIFQYYDAMAFLTAIIILIKNYRWGAQFVCFFCSVFNFSGNSFCIVFKWSKFHDTMLLSRNFTQSGDIHRQLSMEMEWRKKTRAFLITKKTLTWSFLLNKSNTCKHMVISRRYFDVIICKITIKCYNVYFVIASAPIIVFAIKILLCTLTWSRIAVASRTIQTFPIVLIFFFLLILSNAQSSIHGCNKGAKK